MTQEEIIVRLGINTEAISHGLEVVKHEASSWASELQQGIAYNIGPWAAGFAVAAGIENVFKLGQEIRRTSEEAGMGAEQFQKLVVAARNIGVESDQVEKNLTFLSKLIGEAAEGSAGAIEKFDRWHISIRNTDGSLRSAGEVLDVISDSMHGMHDTALEAAMATDLLGKSAAKLIDLLKDGSTALHQKGEGSAILTDADLETIDAARDKLEGLAHWLEVKGAKLFVALSSQWGDFLTGGVLGHFHTLDEGNNQATTDAINRMWRDFGYKGRKPGFFDWMFTTPNDPGWHPETSPTTTAAPVDQLGIDKEKLKQLRLSLRGLELQNDEARPYYSTVAELAASGHWADNRLGGQYWVGTNAGMEASQIEAREARLRQYTRIHGYDKQAAAYRASYIAPLYEDLERAGFIDNKELQAMQKKLILNLQDRIDGEGVPISPKMAE